MLPKRSFNQHLLFVEGKRMQRTHISMNRARVSHRLTMGVDTRRAFVDDVPIDKRLEHYLWLP